MTDNKPPVQLDIIKKYNDQQIQTIFDQITKKQKLICILQYLYYFCQLCSSALSFVNVQYMFKEIMLIIGLVNVLSMFVLKLSQGEVQKIKSDQKKILEYNKASNHDIILVPDSLNKLQVDQ